MALIRGLTGSEWWNWWLSVVDRMALSEWNTQPGINIAQKQRIICDLGVKNPQIISSIEDTQIQNYFIDYPVTEYIQKSIHVFEGIQQSISEILTEENIKSEKVNAKIYKQINSLDQSISSLKKTDNEFVTRDNLIYPYSFTQTIEDLKAKIFKWKNRKTKIIGDVEISFAAKEFDEDTRYQMNFFFDKINHQLNDLKNNIEENLKELYNMQDVDYGYEPNIEFKNNKELPMVPSIEKELLKLKEVTYEQPKKDIFGLLIKNEDENKPVRVVTSYYEHWREKVVEIMIPIAEKYVNEQMNKLIQYYDELSHEYHIYLTNIISSLECEKERVSEQLSDDERKLQEDNNWLSDFKEKLELIERG